MHGTRDVQAAPFNSPITTKSLKFQRVRARTSDELASIKIYLNARALEATFLHSRAMPSTRSFRY